MPGILRLSWAAALLAAAPAAFAQSSAALTPLEQVKQGHSAHGAAFDAGPRQKPWEMPGIGSAPFPITYKNPEVQKWFNQGNAMLHSFDFYEAERAFRWCNKLEPDNAMVYWGLARATNGDRAKDFLREAVKRKDKVTERERLYIEAMAADVLDDPVRSGETTAGGNFQERQRMSVQKMETLCLKYPDDMEARAYLALANMTENRYGTELVIREVLSKQPMHPGAHHYRIHNWDYHEAEQALESCKKYTEAVPNIGHAQHMPGHIYSIVGMWNEAAISMDTATRVEKRYMRESLTFPFDNWNYGHNRYYLSYIQEQLGMAEAAIAGSRELIDTPQDPQGNGDQPRSTHSYGIAGLSRAYLKSERWDDILKPGNIPWRDIPLDNMNKAYFETRAWLGKGELEKAEKSYSAHAALSKTMEKEGNLSEIYKTEAAELKARIAIARGETIVGLGFLADAAERELKLQRQYADPPTYPQVLYNSLGEEYLKAKSPLLAAQAFEKALDLTKNDIFSLSGLVRSYAQLGAREKAQQAMARLLYTAANADQGLKPLELAKSTGITSKPDGRTPQPERVYSRMKLDSVGPGHWEPYDAPKLDVRDTSGKPVSLEQFRGKNIILVYYLGFECPHCMRQLHDIVKKNEDWQKLNTVVLAVSSATPARNAEGVKQFGNMPVQLLSDDTDHANARRFHSYDDFEGIELHSTTLIDRKGRAYWGHFGGDPFTDMAYLQKQVERMNQLVDDEEQRAKAPSSGAGGLR